LNARRWKPLKKPSPSITMKFVGVKGNNRNTPDSPQAKELENFADFFMNETENVKRFGADFDF